MDQRAELYIKRLLLFLLALIFVIAGLNGNIGSLFGSLIDTAHMQEGNFTGVSSQ